ncbi:MAG: DUF1566 domain-containing protein [Cellvibrionaceae bacterium]|nr:DUF1566 domain-containing protein [Cellvibrionaceae bacterium]
MKSGFLALSSVFVAVFSVSVSAELIDLGNGLIEDTSQNITWLKDANLVKTSCDANNALWQAFDPLSLPAAQRSGKTKQEICDGAGGFEGGLLNWYEAQAWVAVLNAQAYLGYSDWRQPATRQPDVSCSGTDVSGQKFGYRCTGSELGHLFNVAQPHGLGNPNHAQDNCIGTLPHCLQNTGPFSNMESYVYWSETEYAPNPEHAWYFSTLNGYQFQNGKGSDHLYVIALRSQAGPVQPVPALGGFGFGLLGLLMAGLAGWRVRFSR